MQLPWKPISRGPYVGRILLFLALLCVAALQPAFGQGFQEQPDGHHSPEHTKGFTIKDLGTLPSGGLSQANAINNRGQVVGYAITASGAEHAFLFEDRVMTDLGTLPGGDFSLANGINDRGQVVGVADTERGGVGHAFLFEHGVMTDLGTLPGGGFSQALGINNRGQVVGGANTASAAQHAALWTSDHCQSDHDYGEDESDHKERGH
jgi:probable HAF family extracellular repeat protein